MSLRESLRQAPLEEQPLLVVGSGAGDQLPTGWQVIACPPGTALSVGAGAALSGPGRPVLVLAGDGDIYGAQLGELAHLARQNVPVTVLVVDNGFVAPHRSTGEGDRFAIRPLEVALATGATFIAQVFGDDQLKLTHLIALATGHPGFSLINVLTQGKQFFGKSDSLDDQDEYDEQDRRNAVERVSESDAVLTGIIYYDPDRRAAETIKRHGPPSNEEWQSLLGGNLHA